MSESALSTSIQSGLKVVTKLLKLGAAASGQPSVAVSAVLIGEVAQQVTDARTRRRIARTERLLASLGRRMNALEADSVDEEHVDLFSEFMAKAIEDEDNAKTDLYAAFMSWIIEKNPMSHKARILGEAIRNLSFIELEALVEFVRGGGTSEIRNKLDENLFWNRVASWGLFQGGSVKFQTNATELGSVLVEIWPKT